MSSIEQQINNFPTPFFLWDKDHLHRQVELIRSAFATHWDNYRIAYSVKTNPLPALCKFLSDNRVDAEVVSYDEYLLAKEVGYQGMHIVCNGPIKSEEWICEILRSEAVLNIDSKSEVAILCRYATTHPDTIISVGIRVNNNIEDLFPHASTASELGGRFGFSEETGELEDAINALRQHANIQIVGLHLHTSTNLRSVEVYRHLVDRFHQIAMRYTLQHLNYIDIGGGFFGEVKGKPGWDDYAEGISKQLTHYGYDAHLQLIIEPGVSLLAGCFSYYTTVRDVKQTKNAHFVVVDGSRTHIDPLFHKKKNAYFCELLPQENHRPISAQPQTLCGSTCLEQDIFFTWEQMPRIEIGDRMRFDKVGAYTLAFSPLFINWFPTVYAVENGVLSVAREKWTTTEIVQKSHI